MLNSLKKYKLHLIIYAVCVAAMLMIFVVAGIQQHHPPDEKTLSGFIRYRPGSARVNGTLTLDGKGLAGSWSFFSVGGQMFSWVPAGQGTVVLMAVPTIRGPKYVVKSIQLEGKQIYTVSGEQVVNTWFRQSVLESLLFSLAPALIFSIFLKRKPD